MTRPRPLSFSKGVDSCAFKVILWHETLWVPFVHTHCLREQLQFGAHIKTSISDNHNGESSSFSPTCKQLSSHRLPPCPILTLYNKIWSSNPPSATWCPPDVSEYSMTIGRQTNVQNTWVLSSKHLEGTILQAEGYKLTLLHKLQEATGSQVPWSVPGNKQPRCNSE